MHFFRIVKRIILIIVILLVGGFIFFDLYCASMTGNVALSHSKLVVQNIINESLYNSVAESGISYDNMANIKYDDNGNVKAIETNSSQINLLKSYLVKDVNEYISNYDVAEVGIPIGTFTGSDYLSGMGPEIDVSVQFSGVAITEIFSEFTSAGINQTCHRIVVKTQVEISVITLGKRLSDSVENECCIAETVIVGTVPETYADIIKNY